MKKALIWGFAVMMTTTSSLSTAAVMKTDLQSASKRACSQLPSCYVDIFGNCVCVA